ncbi:hypothetical protein QJQ45_009990 [Haematococcus lacustris]|nr:hypothetical protein QJQ45_009990 [Haematococcus lacustris]
MVLFGYFSPGDLIEAGAVVPSEVVEARLYDQLLLWVEACTKRALLASLLLGLMVRDCFTRVTVLAYGQELLEEIPAEVADIPDFAERNLFLQLGRGLPPPGEYSRPSDAVEAVLAAYPDLHAELDTVPRYPQAIRSPMRTSPCGGEVAPPHRGTFQPPNRIPPAVLRHLPGHLCAPVRSHRTRARTDYTAIARLCSVGRSARSINCHHARCDKPSHSRNLSRNSSWRAARNR